MSRLTDTSKSPHAELDAVPMSDVTIDGGFWGPKLETNRRVSLPHQWDECERTGRADNFRVLAGRKDGEITKHLAPDSDMYKWAEAVSYDLSSVGETPMAARLDEFIGLVAASQDPSGYLDSSFQRTPEKWWTNLAHGHELYCGGHLIQAAVAHHRATGSAGLLDVAVKWADYVCGLFGPGAREGSAGHAEVEMALVELYRETGEQRYLDLAVFLTEKRGKSPPVLGGSPYLQDHLPIREQRFATGHAVRQMYLACGVTDIYCETGDGALLEALEALWENFVDRKMYVTGGAGARYQGEAFGGDYELPNGTAYAETCAAIGSFMWNWRMLQATAEAKYADVMETALYNGLLSGASLEGTTYFYTNPLEHDGGVALGADRRGSGHRGANERTSKHWDSVPCCPPNVARTIASLGGGLYGVRRGAVYVHHYASGTARVDVGGGKVKITQRTGYPWSGRVEITVEPEGGEAKFDLCVRIPGWAGKAGVLVGGRGLSRAKPGSYARVSRTWKAGEKVTVELPMPVRRVVSHPRVTENTGCVAVARGPVVYCVESADHPGADIHSLELPDRAEIEAEIAEDLLEGVVVLKAEGVSRAHPGGLYRTAPRRRGRAQEVPITMVPYFAWANREPGAMRVWLPRG